jgi:hypothetical protein
VKTEEEMKAEEAMTEKEKEAARKKVEHAVRKPRIRPLSEAKAIETGANFVAEAFIFSVGISVIVFEQWRQRRKAKNQRDDIREDLEAVQEELKAVKAELENLKAQHPPASAPGKLLGFWKGKSEPQKTEDQGLEKDKKQSALQPASTPSSSVEESVDKQSEK